MIPRALKWASALFLICSAIGAGAQESHWAKPDDPVAKMMIDSERKWAEANCDHNPIAASLLADDFMGTAPEGTRYERAEEVKNAADMSKKDRNCHLDGAKVRFFTGDLALVYGSERSTSKTTDGHERLRCLVWTDTWLKRNGRWQIIAAQDTEYACK